MYGTEAYERMKTRVSHMLFIVKNNPKLKQILKLSPLMEQFLVLVLDENIDKHLVINWNFSH